MGAMMELEQIEGILFPGVGRRPATLLKGDTHIGRWIKETRRIDHDQNALPRILELRGARRGNIWDIGAYVGDHTCAYADVAKTVVAVEGRPDAYVCLRENTRWYANVTALCLSVGDGVESASPDLTNEFNAGARRLISGFGCRTTRLDHMAQMLLRDTWLPALIKMDIEGWEVQALRGASWILSEVRPDLVLEVNRGALIAAGTTPYQLAWLLQELNYRCVDLFTREPWNNPDDGVEQRDIIAWPVEKGVPWP